MECRILFHDKSFTGFDWCRLDESSADVIDSGSSTIEELKVICADSSRVTVFLPQQDIRLSSPQLASKAGKQQLNAIAYSIEELLGQDVEDCFFAIAPQRADHSVPVAVIAREVMDDCAHCLSSQHVNARLMLPQIYLCPWSDDEDLLANVFAVSGGYLVRYGVHDGLFCHESLLKPLIILLMTQKNPSQIRLEIYGDSALDDDGLEALQINRQASVELLAQPISPQSCINLKQKEYQSTHQWLGLLNKWRLPMVAMLVLGLVFIAQNLLDGMNKQRTYDEIMIQQRALLTLHLPDQASAENPKKQLAKALSDSRGIDGQAGFVDLLHEYATLKKGFDTVTSDKMQYQQAQLVINLETKDLKSLESFREKLNKSRFLAQIENVSINPDKTTGRLVMRDK